MEMIRQKSAQRANGWTQGETALLMQTVQGVRREGQPVRVAFDRVAEKTGRKPNSVRNYYYLALRANPDEAPPVRRFTCFTPAQNRELVAAVLTQLAQGKSVRSSVKALAGGDDRLMLRYQNKFRSLVKHHPEMVRRIVGELREQNVACADPYAAPKERAGSEAEEMGKLLGEALSRIDPAQALQLLGCLTALAKRAQEHVSLSRKAEAYERLSVRYDMLMLQMQELMEKVPENSVQNA